LIVVFREDFTMLKYMASLFFVDMGIRVFLNPKFSPILIIARLMVRKQTPLYVGAPQKRFAWIIGFVLSGTIVVLLSIMNTYSPITGIICMICIVFLFFETAFNICIGCKLYGFFYKEKVQYCPGEICEVKDRTAIQKVSKTQIGIVFGFLAYIFLLVFLMKDYFSAIPSSLF